MREGGERPTTQEDERPARQGGERAVRGVAQGLPFPIEGLYG